MGKLYLGFQRLFGSATIGAARAAITLFFISLVFSVGSYLFALNAIHRTQVNAATTVQLCRSGNEFRQEQIRLWQFVVSISKKPQSPEQQQRVVEFERYLHRIFAPRNCTDQFSASQLPTP